MKLFRLTLLLSTALAFTVAGIFPQGAVLCVQENGSITVEFANDDSCSCNSSTKCKSNETHSAHEHCAIDCQTEDSNNFQDPKSCDDLKLINSLTFNNDSSIVFFTPYFIPRAPLQFEEKLTGIYYSDDADKETSPDFFLSHRMNHIKTTRLII